VSAAAPVGDASSDVEIDGPLVARALRALVDNAVRHSGSPAVHVSWSARDALVEIEVRDRGCGVPPDSVPDPPRGAGGLAVAARLAEALGGALEIVERVGGGTLARLRVEGTVSAPATAARRNTQPAATGASRSSRVLLVDDNEVNRRLAAAMLARVGVACDVVDSGAAAHVALASVPYGLVLMDVQMPGMDGREATRVWRRTASGASPADVPVVALTAHVGEEEREACVRAGMDDYLSKPFGLDGLTAVVRRWLDPDQASEPAR
jgi:CheY-like chemotaxis protein